MAHGVYRAFTVAITSGAVSAQVDLGQSWAKVCFDITGLGFQCGFEVADSTISGDSMTAGTYRTLGFPVASGLVSPAAVAVGTAASGKIVEVPELSGHRFINLIPTNAVTNGASVKIICSDL